MEGVKLKISSKRRECKRFKKKNYTSTGIVGEVHEEAANLVEGFQPYNNDGLAREHPLWVLSKPNKYRWIS